MYITLLAWPGQAIKNTTPLSTCVRSPRVPRYARYESSALPLEPQVPITVCVAKSGLHIPQAAHAVPSRITHTHTPCSLLSLPLRLRFPFGLANPPRIRRTTLNSQACTLLSLLQLHPKLISTDRIQASPNEKVSVRFDRASIQYVNGPGSECIRIHVLTVCYLSSNSKYWYERGPSRFQITFTIYIVQKLPQCLQPTTTIKTMSWRVTMVCYLRLDFSPPH